MRLWRATIVYSAHALPSTVRSLELSTHLAQCNLSVLCSEQYHGRSKLGGNITLHVTIFATLDPYNAQFLYTSNDKES